MLFYKIKLINAIQSIKEKGEIFIETFNHEKEVVVAITDNGCGISDEHLPQITNPFFTTKAPGKGTGMGLSTVRGIVESHNGFIRVDSKVEIIGPHGPWCLQSRVRAKTAKRGQENCRQ